MDILIPDSWLRDYLKTKATPKQIAEYLSLCGPSIDRVVKKDSDTIYLVDLTTNRVDAASIYGIAREASVILPRFKVAATLQPVKLSGAYKFRNKVSYLTAKVDANLCQRFTAVLIKNVKIADSPDWMRKRLESVGIRAINNIVDISNYLMVELGQPVHTFDYDKIQKSKMVLRESKKGETLTTLDDKIHKLPGGDIVIEDGSGKLIDLAGIMGGKASSIDENTKNVLLFVQTYEASHIRKTSMTLAHRTQAAELFEKGTDPENVKPTILRGVELFEKLTGGKSQKEILDIYPKAYIAKELDINLEFINKILGIEVKKEEVDRILNDLGFGTKLKNNNLSVTVPSWRALDIEIPEDIVEEVARIYGYHNLPSHLMQGNLPLNQPSFPFELEKIIKNTLKGFGGTEVYTLSLVSKSEVSENALRIKNPLGSDGEYLRTSLMQSLVKAAKDNSNQKETFHLFEIANLYFPRKNDLPNEVMTLAGIFSSTDFRLAKGFVEALLKELNIEFKEESEDSQFYKASQRNIYKVSSDTIGEFGTLESNLIYYEFQIEKLNKYYRDVAKFVEIPKYPAQIEDLTLIFPEKIKIGEVIASIKLTSNLVSEVQLKDIYRDSYTFRLDYQHKSKTLTDGEVEVVRNQVLKVVKERFGGSLKG